MNGNEEKSLYEPYLRGGMWEYRCPMTLGNLTIIGTSGGYFSKEDAQGEADHQKNESNKPAAQNIRQREILDKIEAAQQLLSDAASLACPLAGWVDQWEDIGKGYDSVKALWWRIHEAPAPGEPVEL